MSLTLMIGLFLVWQLVVLFGALRLVRFAGPHRLPRPARVPREWATGEWIEGVDPAAGDPTGAAQ